MECSLQKPPRVFDPIFRCALETLPPPSLAPRLADLFCYSTWIRGGKHASMFFFPLFPLEEFRPAESPRKLMMQAFHFCPKPSMYHMYVETKEEEWT